MSDSDITALLVVSFATFVTTHFAIVVGLLGRPPRWRAAVALLLVPLAAFWAFRGAMRGRLAVWLVSLAIYLIALAAATRREHAVAWVAWIEPGTADFIPVPASEALAPLRLV